MKTQIHNFKNWIFDMDGTLTLACHDFAQIRRQLGMPQDKPILEEINKLPQEQAEKLHQQLYDIEFELAHQAKAQPHAETLLSHLRERGYEIGILTRNSLEVAFATLNACGLIDYFKPENILGRESCAPKPDPEGVLKLIGQWGCEAKETVMVGDYWFDLKSGHAAGAHTIHFDVIGSNSWPEVTHFRISSFSNITDLIIH